MRLFFLFTFFICNSFAFSQKVTLTPISFNKDFSLEKAPTTNVLKDYTQFSNSPFKKIPDGFTLSGASVFYKFDTLNCSLFIKNRKDVDGIYYYRDCEDGRYCASNFKYTNYENIELKKYKNRIQAWEKDIDGCCDLKVDFDTTALYYNNEFVDFVDFISLDKNVPHSIVAEKYVTNREYDEFMDYCIDSINRYVLSEIDTSLIANPKFREGPINYSKKYNPNTKENTEWLAFLFYPQHERLNKLKLRDPRKIVHSISIIPRNLTIALNLPNYYYDDYSNNISGKKIKQCSNVRFDISYSQMENIRHEKIDFSNIKDEKTLQIATSLLRFTTNISPDTLSWITDYKNSEKSNYLIWASENYANKSKYKDLPIQGINYWQAKSFLEWKTFFHNRQLRREKKPYRVLYTFPLPEEVAQVKKATIETPEINFEDYIITNKEYEEFVTFVLDSTIFKLKVINYDGKNQKEVWNRLAIVTYSEYGGENEVYDWLNNKKYYGMYFGKPKEYLKKTDSLFELYEEMFVREFEADYLKYDGFDTRKIFYTYSWMYYNKDTLQQNRNLNLAQDKEVNYSHVYGVEDRSEFIIRENLNIFPGYDARDLNKLDERLIQQQIHNFYVVNNVNGQIVRLPDSLNEQSNSYIGNWKWELDSITEVKINFYDFKKEPNSPIAAINYEQAKAYYHWKNEVPYFPTKEEWQQIQKGINPYEVKELEVPGPFFRYAIRVYPVREEER